MSSIIPPDARGDATHPDAPSASADPATRRLQDIRRELLDLSRRNRLLNLKRDSRSATILPIVDERITELFKLLVIDGKALSFKAREDAGEDVDFEQDGLMGLAPADSEVVPRKHTDLFLQTRLESQALQRRLLRLSRDATSALQEQGTNLLFLALGAVEWTDGSREPARAPLLFLPVELTRPNVNKRHSLRLIDEDIAANPCLFELARRDFGQALPEFEGEDIRGWLTRFAAELKALPGWSLREDISLGLFSFAKLLLYHDLDPQRWPEGASPTEHALVRRLLDVEAPEDDAPLPLPRPNHMDEVAPSAQALQVLDADSSQRAAIAAALQGTSFVVQGPPGTGKSQTITNIIAECLGAGKTVLFVAEKAAALEVVERRLEQAGLRDFALELHSRKGRKRAVYSELGRVLELPREAEEGAASGDELAAATARLNALRQELHRPRPPLQRSAYQMLSRAIALRDEVELPLALPELVSWDGPRWQGALELADQLDRALAQVGDPARHPWRRAGWSYVGVGELQALRAARAALSSAWSGLRERASAFAASCAQPAPEELAGCERLEALSELLRAARPLAGAGLDDERWEAGELGAWLDRLEAWQAAREAWRGQARDSAAEVDWGPVIARRRQQSQAWMPWLRGSWRQDSALIALHAPEAVEPAAQIVVLERVQRSRARRAEVEAQQARFASLFGELWRGLESPIMPLRARRDQLRGLRQRAAALGLGASQLQALIAGPEAAAVEAARAAFAAAAQTARAALASWDEALQAPSPTAAPSLGLAALAEELAGLEGQDEVAHDWAAFRRARVACEEAGLSAFADWAQDPAAGAPQGRLAAALERQMGRLWLDEVFRGSPSLRGFRGEDQAALRARFAELDRAQLRHSQARLAARLARRRPDPAFDSGRGSRLGILRAEARKKQRHMPLRRCFKSCAEVIQRLKPCFLMSPLSVAQYLEPGGLRFDLVIFDEASQVEPADALGAIARGEQLILVGDDKQLPPTRFFSRTDGDATLDGEDDDEDGVRAADLESILQLGAVHLRRQLMLRWHYRSAHESLIAFSNAAFYDQGLRIFPGPTSDRRRLGLSFRFVPEGRYLRGQGRCNPAEARALALALVAHARTAPELSVGIGAFSLAQQRAIEDAVEALRRSEAYPELEALLARHAELEPLFVKNLETIQGDERDLILLSVGYGKDPDGKLSMNFGPLNRDGGWRRLNVLVTRSRRRCLVFASITDEDIDLARTGAEGVRHLKGFLEYARTGRTVEIEPPSARHDGDFEDSVAASLRASGYEVDAKVGAGGFWVDLAIRDPRRPGRYLLGLEADGQAWSSSHTARDRERLRQEVLERLGWQVERLWSVDWFHRPQQRLDGLKQSLSRLEAVELDGEGRQLEEALDELLREAEGPAPEAALPEDVSSLAEDDGADEDAAVEDGEEAAEALEVSEPEGAPVVAAAEDESGGAPGDAPALPEGVVRYTIAPPRILGDAEALFALEPRVLGEQVWALLELEAPIHERPLLQAVAGWYGTSATARPKAALRKALGWLEREQRIVRRGAFVWLAGAEEVAIRQRGEGAPTQAQHIPPEEYEAALTLLLEKKLGCQRDALLADASKLLGFGRLGKRLREQLEAALGRLEGQGRLRADDEGFLSLAPEA